MVENSISRQDLNIIAGHKTSMVTPLETDRAGTPSTQIGGRDSKLPMIISSPSNFAFDKEFAKLELRGL